MTTRTFIFRSGPLEVLVSAATRKGPGQTPFHVDFYHAGDDQLPPRFVCTLEEVTALGALAEVADDLTRNYLRTGVGFAQWCHDYGLDPADPDLASRAAGGSAGAAPSPLLVRRLKVAPRG